MAYTFCTKNIMTKVDWVKQQIEASSEDRPALGASFIELIEQVSAAGDELTRFEFMRLVDRLCPDEPGPEFYQYMLFTNDLEYSADFSEAWEIKKWPALPIVTTASSSGGISLPEDFVRLGGDPEWLQDDSVPICPECDRDMVLLIQIKSLPRIASHPELEAYCFGDMGTFYVFNCCNTFTTLEQCH